MGWLIFLILFPIALCISAHLIWKKDQYEKNLTEIIIQIICIPLLVIGLYFFGIHSKIVDTEIFNGMILSKHRIKGHYITTYPCNCDSKGHCQTCTQQHYTVEWLAKTNIGKIQFKYLDWTTPAVYLVPNPKVYKNCIIGEPASIEKKFKNYIKAVPESLFYEDNKTKEKYKNKIPNYPRVYDFYKINRVLNVGSTIPINIRNKINTGLNEKLKTLGNQKQVNIIVILSNIKNPAYRYAVENAWLGGKKNDVIIFVGLNGNKIIWADAMTWAKNKGNELFNVKTRDAIKDLKTFNDKTLESVIISDIVKYYKRPQMSDFEYLKRDIQPSTIVTVFLILLSLFGSILISFMFHPEDSPDPIRDWLERQ